MGLSAGLAGLSYALRHTAWRRSGLPRPPRLFGPGSAWPSDV